MDINNTPPVTPTHAPSVLCIEDEYFISELYNRALVHAGYTVKVCISGEQGLSESLSNAYDFILLDIMIPGLNGIEVLERIKQATPPIKGKIVIMTNMQQSESERKEAEAQVSGYLIKAEITPKQLVSYLATL